MATISNIGGTGGRSVFISAAVFVIAYIAALWLSTLDVPESLKIGIGVTSVLLFAVFMMAEVRMVRGLDELERRIQLEALALGFPLSVGLLMLLGLFQRFIELPEADLSIRHLWPFMVLFYALGLALARGRYR